jgi:hypothetical protein
LPVSILRALARWLGRLLGVRQEERSSPDELAWRALLNRFQAAHALVREAHTADELAVAHCALLSASADLQFHLRLAKRERGLSLRPLAENDRLYGEMVQRLRGEPAEAAGGLG